MSKSGIVNVRMVITEEKILSNIDKVQKLINPKSKKQIVELEEDSYFKDLVESIKTYFVEYPKKKNFPISVYKSTYSLVEFATSQFEENTKRIEELIKKREENISLSAVLKDTIEACVDKQDNWQHKVEKISNNFGDDIIDSLNKIGKAKTDKSQGYIDSMKFLNARVNNLEANLHIEIDMERLEDSSKALSYIGIELADALKVIPIPEEQLETVAMENALEEEKRHKAETEEIIVPKSKVISNKEHEKSNIAAIKSEIKHEEPEIIEEDITEDIVQPNVASSNIKATLKTRYTNASNNIAAIKMAKMAKNTSIKEKELDEVIENNSNKADTEVRTVAIKEKANIAKEVSEPIKTVSEQKQEYIKQTTFETKPSLWQRFKNSKLVRAATYIFRIKIRIELPNALPEGRGE